MKRIICLIIFLAAFCTVMSADGTGLRTVVIDAGHGGKDSGCVSRDGKTYEKTLVLDIANTLAKKIRDAYPDVKVIQTRSNDTFIPLNDRAEIANDAKGDLFISIHINSFDKTTPNGYSVHVLGQSSSKNQDNIDVCRRENSVILLEDDYTTKYQGFDPNNPESFIFMTLMQNSHLEQSLRFAQIISDNLKGGPIKTDRGIWQNSYLVLWRTAMPAVLVELGFISNSTDLSKLRVQANRSDLAQRIFNAFSQYKKIYDESVSLSGMSGHSEDSSAVQTEESVSAGDTLYAVQILVSSKEYRTDDPLFLGYAPLVIRSGKYNKYYISVSGSEAEARKNFKAIKAKYADAFLVKIQGKNVDRLK